MASFGDRKVSERLARSKILLSPSNHLLYHATLGTRMQATIKLWKGTPILRAKGTSLGCVSHTCALLTRGEISSHALELLGWQGTLDDGIVDALWRTLVANRTPKGNRAPVWYLRACTLALTKLSEDGRMELDKLLRSKSEAKSMIEYLQRVHDFIGGRAAFSYTLPQSPTDLPSSSHTTTDSNVGIGPNDMWEDDFVCLLLGCSVPVILRPKDAGLRNSVRVKKNARRVSRGYVLCTQLYGW